MKLPVNPSRNALLLVAALAAALLGACGHDIGDQCTSSVDCDPSGTRSCDLSQPNGYCTIQGCDETLCPSSSACIRIFPTTFLSTACDPDCEDLCPDPKTGTVEDKCTADEVCVEPGLCAKQASEQRYCAKTCSSQSDCRGGYDCRPVGEDGSMLLTPDPRATTSFCAPHVPKP